MRKHTPGPWFVFEGDLENGGNYSVYANPIGAAGRYDLPITRIAGETINVDHLANARLIAAAPALEDACQVALIGLLNDGSEVWRQTAIRELKYALELAGAEEIHTIV